MVASQIKNMLLRKRAFTIRIQDSKKFSNTLKYDII